MGFDAEEGSVACLLKEGMAANLFCDVYVEESVALLFARILRVSSLVSVARCVSWL